MKIIKSQTSSKSCFFSRLPDDIVLEILSRLVILRTLCFCKLVSKRYYRIVHQVDTISYHRQPSQLGFPKNIFGYLKKGVRFQLCSKLVTSSYPAPPSECKSIQPAIKSMETFKRLKSLSIELPSFFKKSEVFDNGCLFKWQITFSNKVDSFVFLSPNSICYSNNGNGLEEEEDTELRSLKYKIAMNSWYSAMGTFKWLMFGYTTGFPFLEKVSITESSKKGRISLRGEKIVEMCDEMCNGWGCNLDSIRRMRKCYIPLLELPDSGCIMKEVTLYLFECNDLPDGYDSFMKSDLDDDKKVEEAAYNEAVIEIFKEHNGRIQRLM